MIPENTPEELHQYAVGDRVARQFVYDEYGGKVPTNAPMYGTVAEVVPGVAPFQWLTVDWDGGSNQVRARNDEVWPVTA